MGTYRIGKLAEKCHVTHISHPNRVERKDFLFRFSESRFDQHDE